jgi:hypothetical protein
LCWRREFKCSLHFLMEELPAASLWNHYVFNHFTDSHAEGV